MSPGPICPRCDGQGKEPGAPIDAEDAWPCSRCNGEGTVEVSAPHERRNEFRLLQQIRGIIDRLGPRHTADDAACALNEIHRLVPSVTYAPERDYVVTLTKSVEHRATSAGLAVRGALEKLAWGGLSIDPANPWKNGWSVDVRLVDQGRDP